MGERIKTNVAGVTHKNEDGTDRQSLVRKMTTRSRIDLKDESSERFPEAIGVYNSDGQRLGFVPSYVAKHIRECGIDQIEDEIWASVEFVGNRPGAPCGMQIEIQEYTGDNLEPVGDNTRPIPFKYSGNMTDDERSAYFAERKRAREAKRAWKKAKAEAERAAEQQRREYEAREAERQRKEARNNRIVGRLTMLGLFFLVVLLIWAFINR